MHNPQTACFAAIALATLALPQAALAQVNRVVLAQGRAEIQRGDRAWLVRQGLELRLGDVLRLRSGARVLVRCRDGRVQAVPPGLAAGLQTICPSARRTDNPRNSELFLLAMTGSLQPATQVVEAQPRLRWPAIANAERYRVTMTANETQLWQATSTITERRYDGEPLEPGQRYQLLVEALDGAQAGDRYELTLQRLPAERAVPLTIQIAATAALDLDATGTALALNDLYQEAGASADPAQPPGSPLWWLAADALESADPEAWAVQQQLGRVYLHLGWLAAAQAHYERAATLAAGEALAIATSQLGLATAQAGQADWSAAERSLQAARRSYRQAGDLQGEATSDLLLQRLSLFQATQLGQR